MSRERRRARGAVHPAEGPARKVLNNNVVVVVDDTGREQVLMGRGLGFGLGPTDELDLSKVEKTFVLEADSDTGYTQQLFADAPYELIEAVGDAVAEAETSLGRPLSKQLTIAIIDHVSFLLQRLAEGLRIPDAPLPELAVLYPDEYAAARAMGVTIGKRLGVAVPPEEAVFLTIHILNATRDEPNGTAAILSRRVHDVVTLVEEELGVSLEVTAADHARFVLHVKFLLQRLASNAMLESKDPSFFEFATSRYPAALAVAEKVAVYVERETGERLTDEELLYLIVHLQRLSG